MKILAFDPGSHTTGWAVLDTTTGRVKTGELKAKKRTDTLAQRSHAMHWGVYALICTFKPDKIAFESPFANPRMLGTVIALGRVRGAMEAAIGDTGRIMEFAPTEVKKHATGRGNAQKELVQAAVKKRFKLKRDITPDEADALAVAWLAMDTLKGK